MSKDDLSHITKIEGVGFFDTPEAVRERTPEDDPFVPSAREWKSMKFDAAYTKILAAISVGFGAASLIVSIVVLASKR